jgi:hypothetical protein
LNKEESESLLRFIEHPEGAKYVRDMASDFDKAMKKLLYAPPDVVLVEQGVARGLHEQLEKFNTARKVLEASRKT